MMNARDQKEAFSGNTVIKNIMQKKIYKKQIQLKDSIIPWYQLFKLAMLKLWMVFEKVEKLNSGI